MCEVYEMPVFVLDLGDEETTPETFVAFGVDFGGARECEVTDERFVRKLRGNRFFREIEGEPEEAKTKSKGKNRSRSKAKQADIDVDVDETSAGPDLGELDAALRSAAYGSD